MFSLGEAENVRAQNALDSARQMRAEEVDEAPLLDGKLDEAFWEKANWQGDFTQLKPDLGEPAQAQTRFAVAFNQTHIFVAIRSTNPEGPRSNSRITRRDGNMDQDNAVTVYLDTQRPSLASFTVGRPDRTRQFQEGFHGQDCPLLADLQNQCSRNRPKKLLFLLSGWRSNWALEYRFQHVNLKPDPSGQSTTQHVLTTDYNLTRDFFLRLFTQYNLANSRFYVYGLFGWRFIPPFGALYAGYTADQFDLVDAPFERDNQRTFFVKLRLPIELIR